MVNPLQTNMLRTFRPTDNWPYLQKYFLVLLHKEVNLDSSEIFQAQRGFKMKSWRIFTYRRGIPLEKFGFKFEKMMNFWYSLLNTDFHIWSQKNWVRESCYDEKRRKIWNTFNLADINSMNSALKIGQTSTRNFKFIEKCSPRWQKVLCVGWIVLK